jgi:glycosyltransferase involved in cell wall biosynthesis
MDNLISVIVSTYKKEKYLYVCLKSLLTQTYKNFEVVIADDGSGPETKAVIEDFKNYLTIQHVWHEDIGFRKTQILNLATKKSNGDYLVFLDGDCFVQPNFLQKHLDLRENGVLITGSRILLNHKLTSIIIAQKETFDINLFIRNSLIYRLNGSINKFLQLWLPMPLNSYRIYKQFSWRRIKGCNMSMWKKDLENVDYFNEKLTGWGHEDSDLVFRMYIRGINRKSGAWATEIFHLWHQAADKSGAESNLKIIKKELPY